MILDVWSLENVLFRYCLEVGVKDSTDSTMFVLFEEVAEQVTQLKLADLTSTLENVSVDSAFTLNSSIKGNNFKTYT